MQNFIRNHLDDIRQLADLHYIQKLWLFGSVCTENFTEKSDIDFLAEFEALDYADYADQYFFFCEALEKLLGREVDVVTVKSLSNTYFIQSVEKNKILIYERRNQEIFA